MPAPLNIPPGTRFGKLSTTDEPFSRTMSSGKARRYVKVRCDCGLEKEVSVNNLTSGHTSSCGCALSSGGRRRTVIARGTRFGRWTVASGPTWQSTPGGRYPEQAVYTCVCDCGIKRELIERNLVYRSRSCGCARAESIAKPSGTTRTGNYTTTRIPVGTRFGRFVTVGEPYLEVRGNGRRWSVVDCRCECGAQRTVATANLRNGNSSSCGCLQREKASAAATHGATRAIRGVVADPDTARLYRIYRGIKDRCNRPGNPAYKRYGGRGIAIAPVWASDFEAFKTWSLQNGYADGLECDRIDPDRGYSPANCRWVTKRKNIEHMRKAWGPELDGRLVATAKQLGMGPYELIAEAVRAYLERTDDSALDHGAS